MMGNWWIFPSAVIGLILWAGLVWWFAVVMHHTHPTAPTPRISMFLRLAASPLPMPPASRRYGSTWLRSGETPPRNPRAGYWRMPDAGPPRAYQHPRHTERERRNRSAVEHRNHYRKGGHANGCWRGIFLPHRQNFSGGCIGPCVWQPHPRRRGNRQPASCRPDDGRGRNQVDHQSPGCGGYAA